MRLYKQGSTLRVTIDWRDVWEFLNQWPGSGLDIGDRVSVLLDSRNGDLEDYALIRGRWSAGVEVDERAILALTHNANNYAAERLGRPELAR